LRAVVEREVGRKPLLAHFGGFAIRRRKDAILVDQRPPGSYTKGSELLKRLQVLSRWEKGPTVALKRNPPGLAA
jgi:hypothetical protein